MAATLGSATQPPLAIPAGTFASSLDQRSEKTTQPAGAGEAEVPEEVKAELSSRGGVSAGLGRTGSETESSLGASPAGTGGTELNRS